MVTSLNNRTAGREIGYEVVQTIAGRVTLAGGDVNVRIGTVPAGSLIVGVFSRVVTAITGGTPALGVGVASGGNTLSGALAVTAGSTFAAPATTTGGPLAADTDIWLGTAAGGATAGDAVGGVMFIKPIA
jgi:hypothetical protein